MRARVQPMSPFRRHTREFDLEDGQRMMLRCSAGYIFASATAAALGFAGIGEFALGAVVLLLLLSALLLAAGLLCSAIGALGTDASSGWIQERPKR